MPSRISLTTRTAFSPRLGPDYLLYVSATGDDESIWRLSGEAATELWTGSEAHTLGAPAISPDGLHIAFSVRQHGRALLYVMKSDGTNARIVAKSLDLLGAPAWGPDGNWITSAANVNGVPQLFRVPLDGRPPSAFVRDYSMDPAWSPDGRFVAYSGADIGTTFAVKAVSAAGVPYALPAMNLTRGARHLRLLPGGHFLVFLRGEIQHKDLWLVDLGTGAERRLTSFDPGFDVRDFDISPDAREIVVERQQERSDVVLMDLPRK